MTRESILNFNIGVLGHIDSGKTSLAKALSTVSSTACFDKNPQSKERGITLDLGFSSFSIDSPNHIKISHPEIDKIQITLVDCPGHASLIRTIIGGALIVDLMLLIVDINKGMQTQTAECLVIGQIVSKHMIVVLNKIDLIEEGKRVATIDKMTKRFQKTLETTRFKGAPIIPVSAKLGQEDKDDLHLKILIETLCEYCYIPQRDKDGPFVMSVDHCFTIKGQGAVMTGTILSGRVSINDTIEVPSLKISKKIKSIQMFKQPVNSASQGDRVGVCVTQFDSKILERGLVCTPNYLSQIYACIAAVTKISYFKGCVETAKKFHLTLGHVTVMGKVTFFEGDKKDFSYDTNFKHLDELPAGNKNNEVNKNNANPCGETNIITGSGESIPGVVNKLDELILADKGIGKNLEERKEEKFYFALIEFESPVVCGIDFLLIGSKLDFDVHTNSCRLAFNGHTIHIFNDTNYSKNILPNLKIYKSKQREGQIDRIMDKNSAICFGLFKKETNSDIFLNLAVTLDTGENGVIEGTFGQSGKVKIYFPDGLKQSTIDRCDGKSKRSKKNENLAVTSPPSSTDDSNQAQKSLPVKVFLNFRKYAYDPVKKIRQKPL